VHAQTMRLPADDHETVLEHVRALKPRLFEGLSSSEVASIVAPATKRRFLANSVMAHEGEPADHLFLVIRGRARGFCRTPEGEKVPVFWFPPGELFGGAAFLSKSVEYLVSTEAVNNSMVLVWSRSTIRSLSAQFPPLVENALLIAYDYFVAYRSLHISATCQNARQRLAQVLGNLASGLGQRVADGVELNIRNEELASEANITIFTASRLLNEWQRKDILTKSRGKVVVRSPEALLQSEK
jgi:CRP/FNR family transcriptional regulator, nitrogen oxide reductase regulator